MNSIGSPFLVEMIFSVTSQPITVTTSPDMLSQVLGQDMWDASEHVREEVQRMAAQRKAEEGQFVRELLLDANTQAESAGSLAAWSPGRRRVATAAPVCVSSPAIESKQPALMSSVA